MDFVNRLVERTRSADRATVRPIVGPGFAAAGERGPLLVIDEIREVVNPRATPAASVADPRTGTLVAPASALETAGPERATYAPVVPLVTPDPREPADVDAAPPPTATAPLVSASPGAIEAASVRPAVSPASVATAPTPVPASIATRPTSAASIASARTATTPESSSGEQVIRVHIGRIDVRAPAPVAQPAAKRVAEPLPSVALGRYLDERGRRR